MKKNWVALLLIFSVMILSGSDCEDEPQESKSGAEELTFIFTFPKNSKGHTVEQQNVLDRYKVTTDPTKVLWMHIIALDGNIIKRTPVRSKVTSSGKRIEPITAAPSVNGNYPDVAGTPFETSELLQADGTFGHSDNYIYWFDPMGRYNQLGTAGGLGYLLTDYPIDLRNPIDEITGLHKVHVAAATWQKEQEALLKQAEEGE